jgi:hypothetical protein
MDTTDETYQVTTLEGIRENADGSWQEITLDVLDAGKDAEDRRYAAAVEIGDGERIIEGRTTPKVDEALADLGAQLG